MQQQIQRRQEVLIPDQVSIQKQNKSYSPIMEQFKREINNQNFFYVKKTQTINRNIINSHNTTTTNINNNNSFLMSLFKFLWFVITIPYNIGKHIFIYLDSKYNLKQKYYDNEKKAKFAKIKRKILGNGKARTHLYEDY